ncbi:MAG: hypothetical protein WC548_04430 [Candidatus Pacearchaeota archaeon]
MIGKRGLNLKRASGHLEMIFSFVFFVGFVFFLFLTLNPYDSKSLLESVNIGLKDSFWEMGETNLTTFFLKVDSSDNDCFSLQMQESEMLFDFDFARSHVEDLDGNTFDSKFEATNNPRLTIRNGSIYYRVFMSPEFENGPSINGCEEMEDYIIGNIIERNVLSNKSLTELRQKYYNNYGALKVDLGVPEIFDFSIISEEIPELNMEKTAPSSGEVYAKSYLFEVLNSGGEIINSRFIVKVW